MSERDIFANFDRVRREMDALFGDAFGRSGLVARGGAFAPAVDVSYRDDPPTAVVLAALPGVDSGQLSIEIQGRRLVLAGERTAAPAAGRIYQQLEIERGAFRRVIELGADVRGDEARAVYEDGMLRIELPLAPPQRAPSRNVPVELPGAE
jgi:HSP20 family protein